MEIRIKIFKTEDNLNGGTEVKDYQEVMIKDDNNFFDVGIEDLVEIFQRACMALGFAEKTVERIQLVNDYEEDLEESDFDEELDKEEEIE